MFPTVRVSFRNLPDGCRFLVLLDIVPCDNKRYRYAYHRSSWLVAGKCDPPPPRRLYTHPDSPFTSDQLAKQIVSFEKVKLTNNELDKERFVSSSQLFAMSSLTDVRSDSWRSDIKRWSRTVKLFSTQCTSSSPVCT